MRARAIGLTAAVIAAMALVTASGAATTKGQKVGRIDVSTRAAVIGYLRSIDVSAKGVVIQRGALNYAGSHCPARAWSCANTMHTVVQIAKRGGQNRFVCASARCVVVQVAGASHGVYLAGRRLAVTSAATTNTAKCIKTGGLTQSCSINQASTTANNVAIVVEASASSGLTQTASYTAQITQQTTGSSRSNTACVSQNVLIDGSRNSSVAVNVALEAHQSITISQDSASGGNTVENAVLKGSGSCDATNPLTQTQTLTSAVRSPGSVTQAQNAANSGPNISLDIEQNQDVGFVGNAHGPNTASFDQVSNLLAVASTPAGPVNQTQSSATGGITATINQDSRDVSTASAKQTERQCEDAVPSGTPSCTAQDPPSYSLTQTQYGPVHKGTGLSAQTGNGGDAFTIDQSSTQNNDTGAGQTNVVQADCLTPGNCTVDQTTNVDGQTTTNNESGQAIDTQITCAGSECTSLPTPSIDSSPSNPSNSPEATFAFSDADNSLSLLCSLDGSSYSPCLFGQRTYTGLADGSHTFSVEATDGNGHFSAPASYTWTVSVFNWNQGMTQLAATNVDVGEFGYGGMRGIGTGSIGVSGVSGTVLRAYLYWHGPTNSTATSETVSFGGQSVTGTNIGTSYDNNWNFQNSQSYRADVTSLVTGNGSYALANFLQTGIDVNGVALVVFYDDGDPSNDRNIVLWNGNDSNCAAGPVQDSWDETLTGVPYPGSGSASLDLIVGDGQNVFDDPQLLVNGSELVAAGPNFQGSTLGGSGGNGTGSLWDVKPFDLTPFLVAGPNSVHLATGAFPSTYDCLSLVVALANSPASVPIG
jgi:hypothetical protein